MESRPRFDLTSALARWTADFAARGNLEPGKIAELGSHLRDSIADLQQHGLDDAEAFLIATRRLGNLAQIEAEFEKAESILLPRRALWWLVLGVVGWTTLQGALHVLGIGLTLLGCLFTKNQTMLATLCGMTELVMLGLFFCALRALVNQHSWIQMMVNFIARHPWRAALFVALANGLFHMASSLFIPILCRIVSPNSVGNILTLLNGASMISSLAFVGITAFILGKVRPAQTVS